MGNPPLLPSKHVGGPPAHRQIVESANEEKRILARRVSAWELLCGGATYDEIGQKLGVSGKTAWYDVEAYRKMIRHEYAMDGEAHTQRALARLDRIYLHHAPRAANQASAKVMLEVIAQQRRLLGLDAKDQGETYTPQQVMGLITAMMSLFMEVVPDPHMRMQFATGIRRKIGPAMRAAVPVQVSTNGHPQKED